MYNASDKRVIAQITNQNEYDSKENQTKIGYIMSCF